MLTEMFGYMWKPVNATYFHSIRSLQRHTKVVCSLINSHVPASLSQRNAELIQLAQHPFPSLPSLVANYFWANRCIKIYAVLQECRMSTCLRRYQTYRLTYNGNRTPTSSVSTWACQFIVVILICICLSIQL